MIQVHGLTKRYGATTAVKDLSFSVQSGEVLGLVGPNGAGKTTTLRCLAGIIPSTAGQVTIDGHNLAADPIAAKRALAFFPDEPRLFEYLTVRQHLAFVARIYGVADYAALSQPLLEELEIADKADALPSQLSRGMKQKLVIACGLLHSPRVIFFDEPLTGLDPLGIRRMKDSILRRAREGAAIVLSSHLLHLLQEVCSHVLILKRGEKIADGTLAAVTARFAQGAPDVSLEEIFLRATETSAAVIRALIYLRLMTLKNRVLVSVRRLQQPKYVLGALAGALYVYYLVFGRFHSSYSTFPHSVFSTDAHFSAVTAHALLQIGGAAILTLVLWRQAVVWKSPPQDAGLRFSEAEIAFLFPAPLSRRRLVHFSLIKSQILILLSSLFLSIFFNPRAGFASGGLLHAIGWWVILSALNFHSTGASLTVAQLRQDRPDFARLRLAVLTGIGLIAGAVAIAFYLGARQAGAESNLFAWLDAALRYGPLRYLLYPCTWVVAPFLAVGFGHFVRTLPLALALLAALYIWIVRLEAPIEEGSIALAEKRSHHRADRQPDFTPAKSAAARRLREPFRLAQYGRPEIAFLWKNLFAIQSWFNLRFFVSTIGLVAALLWSSSMPLRHPGLGRGAHYAPLALVGAAMLAFYTFLVGPQLIRQDLRGDLANVDILKTYPLAGWQVVLGEMLTPLAILCGLLWLALLVSLWALTQIAVELPWFSPVFRVVLTLCTAAVIPPICVLQLVIPNAAALLFPTWFQASRGRAGGVEVIGQRLIFVGGQFLAVLFALLPAILAAFLLIFASQWLIGLSAATLIATLAVLVILLTEVTGGLWWLGRRFENLDLSSIEA